MVVVCADWLETCTLMQEEIFTLPAVGDIYNAHFVNWLLDGRDVQENPYIAGVRVMSIPEFIFFDATGHVQYREKQYKDPEMVAMAAAALDSTNHLDRLRAQYKAGHRESTFLERYIREMAAAGEDMVGPSREYLQLTKPREALSQTDVWRIAQIGVQKISDPEFIYVMSQLKTFRQDLGIDVVNDFIIGVYRNSLSEAVTQQNLKLLADCQAVVRKLLPPGEAATVILQDQLTYDAAGSNWAAYAVHANQLLSDNDIQEAGVYNDIAWAICEHSKDSIALKRAQVWAQKSVEIEPAYWNCHTLATLEWLNGDLVTAALHAQQAMSMAEPGSEDAAEVQVLLDKIKKSR